MLSLSNYVLYHGNNIYCFYHSAGRGIVCRAYRNKRWSGESVIVKNTRENFSVTKTPDGGIYLFCQDMHGDIVLSTYKNNEWSSRIALKNENSRVHTVILNPIISRSGLCIIYNMPPSEERSSYLVMRQLNEDGQWSPASRIDKFSDMGGAVYQVQHTSQEHLLLFYQTRTAENNLGYREITPGRVGSYNVFHTTSNYISDMSFLTTDNSIHVCYIVKSMFSNQLIYRKKTDQLFSNPIVLAEGQRIDNCLLTIVKDNLYATFMINEQLYYCMTEDKGNTFSRAARYRKKFCLNPVKACYLSASPMHENIFFVREVYVDRSCPWDIQLLPDLYEDFFMAADEQIVSVSSTEGLEDISKMRNQLALARRQSDEKDKQILHLTEQLKASREEIVQLEMQKEANVKRLNQELSEMADRIAALDNENMLLKAMNDN